MAIPSSPAHSSSGPASGAIPDAAAIAPSNTSPVSPSIVIASPACSVSPGKRTSPSSTSMSRAPTTAGIPHPRATTAAWLASPPRAVRMPAARAMPWTSSGDVSARTRIGEPPASASRTAASGLVTISPLATPGDAPSPVPIEVAPGSRGEATRGGSARIAATRSIASARVSGNPSSLAMSSAIRSAARGLRLPTRTWSSHSLPCSTVNSMSHRSRKWRSSRVAWSRSSRATAGRRSSRAASGCVAWVPATTSSPWAANITSPYRPGSPVAGLRVNTTPVPESAPRLPNTIAWTVTPVPMSSGMPSRCR